MLSSVCINHVNLEKITFISSVDSKLCLGFGYFANPLVGNKTHVKFNSGLHNILNQVLLINAHMTIGQRL